jgi:hypothetical protein
MNFKRVFLIVIMMMFFTKGAGAGMVPVFNNMSHRLIENEGLHRVSYGMPTFIDAGPWTETPLGSRDFYQMMIFRNVNGTEVSAYRGTFVAQPKDNPAIKTVGDLLVYGANKVYAESSGDYVVFGTDPNDGTNYCIVATIYSYALAKYTYSPGTCRYLPAFPSECKILTSEIVLDHKTVVADRMAESIAESHLWVNCTLKGTVQFSLADRKTTLDIGGGTATISINNKPLLNYIDVQAGDNKLKITSELKNVQPGEWQSSAVLIVNVV